MAHNFLRKVVLIGTTGSGKTTFLRNMADGFNGSEVEVPRNVALEDRQILNTFTPLGRETYLNSTTTVSMNVNGILFVETMSNQLLNFPLESKDLPIGIEEIGSLYPTVFFDPAGQERLEFMQDISIKGAHGVIIFADGANIQSIERIAGYYEKVIEEQESSGNTIPVMVFINKKDLEKEGLYVGTDGIPHWLRDMDVDLHETSNLTPETFAMPLRVFLERIDGFPVSPDDVVVKKVQP